MKKINIYLISFFLMLSTFCLFAANKDGRLLFTANLTTSQEVPAVTNSKAKGVAYFMLDEKAQTLTVSGVFDSLSGPVTGCHFHKNVSGKTAGVLFNMNTSVKGNRLYNVFKIPGDLSKDVIRAMIQDSVYINVHTALNTSGEIRGQVTLEKDYHFWSFLTGAEEVPIVNTLADGLGSFVLSQDLSKLEYKVLVSGLSGPITGAHLHYGTPGTTGGVAYPLSYTGNVLKGSLNLRSSFIDSLARNLIYINIHTAANPNGEIRGQMRYLGPLGFDIELNGANETPTPIVTPAKGLMVGYIYPTLDSVRYYIVYDSLTTTNAHFHFGAAGIGGGVLEGLVRYTPAPNAYIGTIGIKPDTVARFLRGEIYANLHSAAHTGGEIRGQVNTTVRDGFIADLCGKQENPANTAVGIGAGIVSIDRNRSSIHVMLATNALTGNATLGHIHKGAIGVNGPAVINFSNIISANGNAVNAFGSIPTVGIADSIVNGLTYFNVHTALFGGGEIRGQILKELTNACLPVSGVFELNGQQLAVKVYPNPVLTTMNITFESNEKFEGQLIVTDLIGRSVISKRIQVDSGNNIYDMNVQNLSNGIYFMRLQKQNQILFSEKFVKH
jgi:hypothetical protein